MSVILIALASCGFGDIDKLKSENGMLREEIQYLINENANLNDKQIQANAEKLVDADRRRRQAGIAAGCKFMFLSCPPSMVLDGKEVLETDQIISYESVYYYLFVTWKIVFVLAIAIFIFFFPQFLYQRMLMPAKQKLEEAKKIISDSQLAPLESQWQVDSNKRIAYEYEKLNADLLLVNADLEYRNELLQAEYQKAEVALAAIVEEHRKESQIENEKLKDLAAILQTDIGSKRTRKKNR
jgi:hypothetical protein